MLKLVFNKLFILTSSSYKSRNFAKRKGFHSLFCFFDSCLALWNPQKRVSHLIINIIFAQQKRKYWQNTTGSDHLIDFSGFVYMSVYVVYFLLFVCVFLIWVFIFAINKIYMYIYTYISYCHIVLLTVQVFNTLSCTEFRMSLLCLCPNC